ncbi:MAG: hypothetical protein ABS46_11030 [Cytophagaceae bacterium SCN 52-12]|nr:MAG: hypothetical protein ABS46_11030 [Cytophagaceae bacterium SCN 52-12]
MTRFRNYILSSALLFALCCAPMLAIAQKEVMFDQYIEAPIAINPAYTGIQEHFNLNILLRRRWFSIPSAPVTPTLYADGTVAGGRVGIGFMAMNDQMSPFATTGFYGSTSYIHRTGSGWKLSLGVQGGINVLPVYGQGYSGRKMLGSFGLGVLAQNDNFYLGFSKPELLSLDFGNQNSSWGYHLPLYASTGGKIRLNEDFIATPNGTVIISNSFKNEIHIGSKLWYKKLVGAGVFFRTGQVNRIHVVAEAPVGKNVRIGYAYDSRTVESMYTPVGVGISGMHELIFRFIPNPVSFNYY